MLEKVQCALAKTFVSKFLLVGHLHSIQAGPSSGCLLVWRLKHAQPHMLPMAEGTSSTEKSQFWLWYWHRLEWLQ